MLGLKKKAAEATEAVEMEVVDTVDQNGEEAEKKSGVGKVVGIVVAGVAGAAALGGLLYKVLSKKTDDGYSEVSGPYDPDECNEVEGAPVAEEADFEEPTE